MSEKTKTIVGVGLITAIVVVLQSLAVIIPVGIFNLNLILVPIVVGAALYGPKVGAWLGFVAGVLILFTNSGAFLAVSIIGTVITVLAKGILSGFLAGIIYNLLKKVNDTVAVATAALVCPIVNTGVFVIGCLLFFMETISTWVPEGQFGSTIEYIFLGMIGVNFLIEMAISIVLSATIVRIVKIGKSEN